MSTPIIPPTPEGIRAYPKERYEDPAAAQHFYYRPSPIVLGFDGASDSGPVTVARVSHVRWVASRVLESAQLLLTQAQLREEELIENLVKAKTSCEATAEPAEAALAAARLVEELEQHIESLTQIVEETTAFTVEGGDEQ